MTEKEISEVRRSLKAEKNAITTICGCYVNATGEIISRFHASPALMSEDEAEKYLTIFRRTLSGAPQRNLLDIPFDNSQVESGEEYALLQLLRSSELKNEEAVGKFFDRVTKSIASEENYVILLTFNRYDVPFKGSDGFRMDDAGTEVYSYLLCSICPVKATKSALTYEAQQKSFRHNSGENAIQMPELGFLYPTFDDRRTNITSALLYTRSLSEDHAAFTEAVFAKTISMTAQDQSETFRTVLAESLTDDCSFRVAKQLHQELCARMEEHKLSREEEPYTVSKYTVKEVLESCGVAEEKLDVFVGQYSESFGAGAELTPKNIVDPKKFEVRTPNVVIKVAPGRSDLIETRVIDGNKYILIRANDGVELNGLNVLIEEDDN
ncbi:MAG: DUF4317 domain-containing protein [Ruminococcaceae bacterium]|nr:DUF4317 domain-containing protein [Oscillospiraceae bacterium]